MPVSKTKQLAKKLGLLKRRPKSEDTDGGARKKRRRGQILSYVIVIDFESTCWEDRKGQQEIIEFPAVLLDLLTGESLDEFHQYVQPQESIKLSQFCKDLTGITQDQVDNGIPLQTCLYLFGRWIEGLRTERGVVLLEPGKEFSEDLALCALVTWSDWDFGVCLNYECRRKQLRKPAYFNQWIDIRAVYKTFYDRCPSGLSGALEDLGIAFSGRQHCGLDDARNTAKLCYRLVRDGCRLDITKCIQNKGQCRIVKSASSASASHSDCADSNQIPAPPTSNKQTLTPPTSSKQILAPPTSSKQTPAPPTSSKQTPAPPTSNKQTLAPPTSSKQILPPPTSSKQTPAPPTSNKQTLTPPTSSKQILAPPTSSKQTPAPPTSNKQTLAPPTSSKQILAPPTSSKQTPAPPTSSKQTPAPPTSNKQALVAPPTFNKKNITAPPEYHMHVSPLSGAVVETRNDKHEQLDKPEPSLDSESTGGNFSLRAQDRGRLQAVLAGLRSNNNIDAPEKSYVQRSSVTAGSIPLVYTSPVKHSVSEWSNFSCDEVLLSDIARELDMCESCEEEPSTSEVKVTDNQVSARKEIAATCTDVDNGTNGKGSGIILQAVAHEGQRSHWTPTRMQCITHVAPITLLPLSSETGSTTTMNMQPPSASVLPKSHFKQSAQYHQHTSPNINDLFSPPVTHTEKLHPARACPAVHKVCTTTHDPSSDLMAQIPADSLHPNLDVVSTDYTLCQHQRQGCKASLTRVPNVDSVNVIAETPPADQTTPSSASSSCGQFRTPSTADWLKIKKPTHISASSSSSSSLQTPQNCGNWDLIGRGKVTPPLCSCGKRTKRKTVSSTGPNEGRIFFACPRGRGAKGCGYFKWEWQSPSKIRSRDTTCSISRSSTCSVNSPAAEMLSSEYFD